MDFGIAKALSGRKLTRTGVAVGTVAYMSPEQIRNQGVDLRSDIYSLGVMLYQMLTAHLPFDSESDFQVQYDHVNTPPPPLSLHYPYVPAAVEAAVLRAMEKDPNRRFRTVEEFSAALEHLDVAPAPYFAAGAGAQTAPQPAIRPSSPNAPVGNMGVTAQPTPYPAHRSATLIERPTFTGAAPTQQTTAAQPAATPPPPAARSSRSGMIVGVAGLALAAVIGVGIWKWSNRKETPPTQTQATNSPAPNTSPQTPAVAPQQQPATTTATPPSPQPDIKHPTTALNVPLPKVEAPSKERKTTTPIEKPAPQPAQPDPGMLALQKSQQLMSTQQLLDPFGNSALSWAIQATQAGNPQGPEMESRIQTQIHDRFEQYLNAKAFPQANILVSSIERYYRPNTFEAWRTELQNSQHAALAVSAPPPHTRHCSAKRYLGKRAHLSRGSSPSQQGQQPVR
jgi:serine/threonine-protein kinase